MNFKAYMRLILLGMLALLAVGLAPASPPEGNWTEDHQAGLSRAEKEKKPVLLMFSASWCGPCNMMKKEVFTQEKVKKTLDSLVAVYIDGDQHRELMGKYKAEAYPTFVVLTPAGKEVGRFVGGMDAERFLRNIQVLQTELPKVEEQISKNPKDPALWKKRGGLLEEVDSLEEAVKAYKEAKRLDPENKTGAAADVAYFDAARIDDEGVKGADKRIVEFIKKYPDSPRAEDAMLLRVRIALSEQRNDEAAKILAEYQQSYPQSRHAEDVKRMQEYLSRRQASASK